jgi:hypothetical protein
MKQVSSLVLISALAVAPLAGSAHAQLFSDPPPPLMGQPSYHLYSVPGVIDIGGLATFFSCSNTTDANIRVGVEVFAPGGGAAINDPSATSLDLSPGATRIFGTGAAVGILVDSNLGAGLISKGLARILATESKGIICSSFLADTGNAPPTSMADLTVVKKTKQKGD